MSTNSWKRIATTYIHENPWYKLRQDRVVNPAGKEATYTFIDEPPSVFIVGITADKKVLLIRTFRYPTQMESWEVPAGGVEVGEDMLSAAKREFQEETGHTAEQWHELGPMQIHCSKSNGMVTVFAATGLRSTMENKQAEEGIAKATAFSKDETFSMIAGHSFTDIASVGAVTMAIAAKLF